MRTGHPGHAAARAGCAVLRGRPYAIVWLDAIHFKVKQEGRVVNKAVYTALGVGPDGHNTISQ